MQELNKDTLRRSLAALPQRDPPDATWTGIQARLAAGPWSDLPRHDPPARVWENVRRQLEGEEHRAVRLPVRRWTAAAAVLAVLSAAGYLFRLPSAIVPDTDRIAYSQTTVDPRLLARDWLADDAAFDAFDTLCAHRSYVCGQPVFQQLQAELAELAMARDELQQALGTYGQSADLIRQIKVIELERTGILKKMMAMLI